MRSRVWPYDSLARLMIGTALVLCALTGSALASSIRTRENSASTLRIEVLTDRPSLTGGEASVDGYLRVSVADLPSMRELGRPGLPYRTFLVGLPAGMDVHVAAVHGPAVSLGSGRIAPVISAEGFGFDGFEPAQETDAAALAMAEDSSVYDRDDWYPESLAVVQKTGVLRDQPYAEIRVYPVRYRPTDGSVAFHPRLTLNLRFAAAGITSGHVRLDPAFSRGSGHLESFDHMMRNAFVNYPMVARDREARRAARSESGVVDGQVGAEDAAAQGAALLGTTGSVKLSVQTNGLYGVTRAQLAAAGVDVTMLDPQTFRLTAGGVDVPVYVEGEGDGSFDTNDRLVFFGRGIQGDRFNRVNVYWLSFGGAPGPRTGSRSGLITGAGTTPASFETTVHAELNLNYTLRIRPGVTEAWYWAIQARGSSTTSVSYPVTLPHVDPAAHTIAARAQMLGLTNGNHTPRLFVNGAQVAENTFANQVTFLQSAAAASSLLLSGANTLSLTLINNGNLLDQVASDFFEVDYRRTYVVDGNQLMFDGEGAGNRHFALSNLGSSDLFLFDITAPGAPDRITIPVGQVTGGAPFTATVEDVITSDRAYVISTRAALKTPAAIVMEIPSSLASPSNGADYIVITDRTMLAAGAQLAALRAAQGLRTSVVATDDINDEFNFGRKSPVAIKSFLTYAYANWTLPAPTYVVLMGDGHIDFTNNLGSGTPNLIPPLLLPFPGFGEAPSDNDFVAVAGGDELPEMFVGRLPVRTLAEATMMVNNIITYENNPPIAALNQQSLYVADNDDVIFPAILNNLMDFTPPAMGAATAYLPGGGDPNNPPSPAEVSATTSAIINGFDAGSLTAIYLGHGNITLWAKEKVLEHTTNPPSGGSVRLDLNLLADSGNMSFLMALNCINGYFADLSGAGQGHADYSLAEEWLRRSNRGAIASYAPSALGQLSDYDSISYELFNHLFVEGMTTLGPASVNAVLDAISVFGVSTDNVESMIFFGDPATRLALDSDRDGLLDRLETAEGTNPLDGDSDDDGLADGPEALTLMTDPVNADSDGDGIFDGTESGVTVPVAGTNIAAGYFVADADPGSTTNALLADTDAGGIPDGSEDANHNGAIDIGESDPNNPGDDLACPGPLVEVVNVTVQRVGSDLVLAWDTIPAVPCATFRVYAATNAGVPKSSFAAFVPVGDVSTAGFTHVGAGSNLSDYDYLVVVVHPQLGEGPFGAYGQ